MRVACRMSAEIRDICAAAVAPGVTTGEIDDLVVAYCKKHNVKASFYQYAGFPGHLCVSINDEVIHGIPDPHRVIMPGDLVSTDVGIQTLGFNGDTSRTVALGVTDPEVLRLVVVTKQCGPPSTARSSWAWISPTTRTPPTRNRPGKPWSDRKAHV